MDFEDAVGDLEPCFENRVTSTVAPFRPFGMFPADAPLDAPLPAGSTVDVELYLAGETPTVVQLAGVLMAADRELGLGEGTALPVLGTGPDGVGCAALGESCWTKYEFSFETDRPAFTGEALTFQVRLTGTRSWAYGHEGAHASKISIVPADTVVARGSYAFPDLGEDPAEAGDHPTTRRVEVSVDDPSFANPVKPYSTWSPRPGTRTWASSPPASTPSTRGHGWTPRHPTRPWSASPCRPDQQLRWQVTPADRGPDGHQRRRELDLRLQHRRLRRGCA